MNTRRSFRRSLSFVVALLAAALVYLPGPPPLSAAPFADFYEFTQPDGTELRLWGEGDEFRAVFETTAGYTVVFDPAQKAYFYAELSPDGKRLVSTGVPAHLPAPASLDHHIRRDRAAEALDARARHREWDDAMQVSTRWSALKSGSGGAANGPTAAPPTSTTTGAKQGLTLLIDFSDDVATVTQAEINSYLNDDAYTGFSNNGSVKKYFSDVSGSRLTYTNVTTTFYVRMTQTKAYYNNTSLDSGTQARLLITDALAILKARSDYASTVWPSFSSLSTDASGRVLATNVLYAGGNGGVWSKGLWPHSWSLASEVSLGTGKSVYRYQITNIGSSLTLGTFCHENGHMLCGFPDIYDYDSDSVGGAGVFCLMNSGGHGTNPNQVCAYLKLAAGWVTATTLAANVTGSLVAAPNAGFDTIYRYPRPGVGTEYFLLENRQKTGRDLNLPAAGIAVWHIDELGDRDNQSLTANSSHLNYEVTLVQADNLWHFQTTTTNGGDSNDLYYLGNTATAYTNTLKDTSTPNAHWWDGTSSGLSLSAFSASGMTMTFTNGTVVASQTVTVAATDATATENPLTTGYFTVSRSGGTSAALTVDYVVSGTATSGGDYVGIGTSVTIPAGAASAPVTVTPIDDAAVEADETVVVTLSAGAGYTVGSPASDTVTIASDDVAGTTLAAALDTALTVTTGGSAGWAGQTAVTHDGADAVASGTIADSQTSWIEAATVTGPATCTFWWKVSSETSFDFLRIYLDGAQQKAISGAVDWTLVTITAPSGAHTLRWEYTKDSSVNSGSDKGWVDQLVCAMPPTVTVASTDATATENPLTTGYFTVSRSGSTSAALTVDYAVSGTATSGSDYIGIGTSVTIPAGAASATVTVTPIDDAAVETDETVVMTLSAGAAYTVGSSASATVTIASDDAVGTTLAAALDTSLTVTTGGSTGWAGQTAVTYDGVDAAASGTIANSQTSWMQVAVTGPATCTFRWKVSSETTFDFLRVYLDGSQQEAISGEVDWTLKTIALSSGAHTLRWEYTKDIIYSSGSDKGWVDQLVCGQASSYVLWTNDGTGQAIRWAVDPATGAMTGWNWISSTTGVGAGWQASSYARGDTTKDYVLWTNKGTGQAIRWAVDPVTGAMTGWAWLSSTAGVGAGWQASSYVCADATTDYVLWTNAATGQAIRWAVDPATGARTGWVWISSTTGAGAGWQAGSYERGDATKDYVLWTNAATGQAIRWAVAPATGSMTGYSWVSSTTGVGAGWQAGSYARGDATKDYVLWTNTAAGQTIRWAVDPATGAITGWAWISSTSGVGGGWQGSSYLASESGGATAEPTPLEAVPGETMTTVFEKE